MHVGNSGSDLRCDLLGSCLNWMHTTSLGVADAATRDHIAILICYLAGQLPVQKQEGGIDEVALRSDFLNRIPADRQRPRYSTRHNEYDVNPVTPRSFDPQAQSRQLTHPRYKRTPLLPSI